MWDVTFIDWEALWNEPPFEASYLAWPLIPTGRLCALNGLAKVGKSLLALEAAACIATGRDFLGHPTLQSNVLYLDFENSPRTDIRPRLEAMGFAYEELARLRYASFPALYPLDENGADYEIKKLLERTNPALVVIDTISRAVTGEENSNDTWNHLYTNTEIHLKQQGIAWLRLDHLGRDTKKGARGGSAKSGTVDVSWTIEETTKNALQLTVESQRMPLDVNSFHLQRHSSPLLHHELVKKDQDEPVDRVVTAVELLETHGYSSSMTQHQTGTVLRQEFKMSISNAQLAEVCQTRKSTIGRDKSPKYMSLSREITDEDLAGVHDFDSPPFNPHEVPPQQDEYY